jgi:hypothetical protein
VSIFGLKRFPGKGDDTKMDWLFTDETAATLVVIVGAGLFAITWRLYGP